MMKREEFRQLLKRKILVLDGGMGSMLLQKGIPPGSAPELLNLEAPEVVGSIHEAYVKAGADVILTNTFGGNRLRLAESGIDGKLDEVNRAAVRIARKASGGKALVAFSIGPSGRFLEPVGPANFDDAYGIFLEQAKIAAGEECDIIIIETMSDIREAKAALIAAREAFPGPVVAQMTFSADGRTVTGTDPLTALTVLSAAGADAVGANCSVGPSALEPVVKAFCEAGDLPVSVEPNAGMPSLKDGAAYYPESPEEFAVFAGKFALLGANLIGGCCGTTPRHISRTAERIRGISPKERKPAGLFRAASRTAVFQHAGGCAVIGERMNPSGRKELSRKLREEGASVLRGEALNQVRAGADLLDVNVGVPQADEPELQKEAVLLVESVCDLPLVIDSSNAAAIESALKSSAGKPVINSVNGERASLDKIIPLAKRYGASLIGLCLDGRGIPGKAEERVEIGRRIVEAAVEAGIPREDIILDALTLPVSAQADSALETVRALELIRRELKVRTVLGVSNISYGLPRRPLVTAAFLAKAVDAGLDFAIVNPLEDLKEVIPLAAEALSGKPGAVDEYVRAFSGKPDEEEKRSGREALTPIELVRRAVLEGDRKGIGGIVKAALDGGTEPFEVAGEGLIKGMALVGERFEKGSCYLPQVILSAETMQAGFDLVRSRFGKAASGDRGTVVFASVKGDIHDIGKNICVTLLENHGFRVVDLGKNVERETILRSAREERAGIVALSALTTTTMMEMGGVIAEGKSAGIAAKFIVGGAVVNGDFARSIGADGYGRNGVECVRLAEKMCAGKA